MYDDLARTQNPTRLEWFVVHAVIPSVLVTFALHVSLAAPRARPPQTLDCSLIIPPLEEPRPDDPPDAFPVLIRMPNARYPEAMRRAGIEGHVVLKALVGTPGRVYPSSILVLRATHVQFVVPAREALIGALFRPGWFGGRRIDAWVTIGIDFKPLEAR